MAEHGATEGSGTDDALSRSALITSAVAMGGGLLLGGALLDGVLEPAESKASPEQDATILNFVLVLEELQTSFYAEGVSRGALSGPLLRFAEVVSRQEREHRDFVRNALGGKARKPPRFDFGDATGDPDAFGKAAQTLEDIGIAAYNAQAPNLTDQALKAAARIVSVEARHAAWISDILGENPAPFAAEPRSTPAEVNERLKRTGFVS